MSKMYLSDSEQNLDASTTPAYLRLRAALRRDVEQGRYAAGQALPSEREMARLKQVSRVTVRKAIAGLVHEGLLEQRHGAGNFVTGRIVKPVSRLSSFSEDLRARGLHPRSTTLDCEIGEASPREVMAMNLDPGARVVRLHRLRLSDDAPLAVERTVIPHALLENPGQVGDSLYAVLDRLGYRPVRALQRLRAVNLDASQAHLLDVAEGSAALAIERRGFLADGRVVEFTRSWYRGDVYDFVAQLQDE